MPFLRRFAAGLALFAMLVPVATMIACRMPLLSPNNGAAATQDCGMNMHGMQHTGGMHGKAAQKVCPICQALHIIAGGFGALQAALFALALIFVAALLCRTRAFALSFACAPQARPRAPPCFV